LGDVTGTAANELADACRCGRFAHMVALGMIATEQAQALQLLA
jgi:hypothetical protein